MACQVIDATLSEAHAWVLVVLVLTGASYQMSFGNEGMA